MLTDSQRDAIRDAIVARLRQNRKSPAGVAGPRQFIAFGCVAPSLLPAKRLRDVARLTGREFAEAVGFFGGLPAEVIADQEMLDRPPAVIADFNMAVGYCYQPGRQLAVPLR